MKNKELKIIKVKKIVEETLSKIESEGDKHIRESQKFDNYSPDSFRLSEDQISINE